MTDHFAYLYEDDEKDFFQKIACDVADQGVPSAAEPIVKTAAADASNVNTFEKTASRFDQDLFIIKTAGPSGFNLGAVHRGRAHFDNLLERVDMEPEQAVEMFEKIAVETIEHDLAVVREEMLKLAGDEYEAWIDAEIAAVGVELVKAAQIDKEAFLGIARTFRAARKGLKASKGLGFRAKAQSVLRAPKQAWRGRRTEVAAAKRTKATGRLGKAQAKLKTMQSRAIAQSKVVKKMPAGQRRSVGADVAARNVKRVDKATAKVQKRQGQLDKATAKHKSRKSIEQGKGPTTPKTPKETQLAKTKATTKKTDIERQKGLDEAGKAGKTKKTKKTKKTEEPTGEPIAASNPGGDATLGGSYKKFRDGGWGSLGGAEKQKLINAGLATVVGHRVVMGKGALTGGEGII